MSAVSVTISGVLYDHATKSGRPVTLIGEALLTGLNVGGGPMPGGPPLGIWGGGGVGDYIDAGFPGPQPRPPLGIWGGGGVGDYIDIGFPLPDPKPPKPPSDRPIEWHTAWTPTTGWIVVGVPTGEHPTPSNYK